MLDQYVFKNNQKMRLGYTTGSCAAAASKAAVSMLLSSEKVETVNLMTPKGIALELDVLEIRMLKDSVLCAIRKDAGDDPDATDGILIYAKASKSPDEGVWIDGGIGVGRVTKKGLEQPVGSAAINRVPRKMIEEAVKQACENHGYHGGISIEVSVPEGAEIARKTFNPRLGIMGGISILGTSGIVEPMSENALIDTIRVDVKMRLAEEDKKYLIIVPGNYGIDFLSDRMEPLVKQSVKCSNFLGEAIDSAVAYGAEGILLIGHIGKFVKLAGGIMNTHSRNADARMEIFTAHAAMAGAGRETLEHLMECVTTDDALDVLQEAGLVEAVMKRLMERMEYYANHRAYDKLEIGIITFSNQHGKLGETSKAADLIAKLEAQESR